MRWRVAARLGAITLYVALAWIAGIACIVVGTFRVLRFVARLITALRPTVRCLDGHDTETYARWRCRDHTYDGWAFRCPICREWAGHIRCTSCGMTVVSPLVRD